MADHGHVEYATAEGNDLPTHEVTYERFVLFAFVGCCHVASVVIGLAIIGTTSHWLMGVGLIILASIAALFSLAGGTKTPSFSILVLSVLTLGFAATT